MHSYHHAIALGVAAIFLHPPPAAMASCGQAFCSVDSRLTEDAPIGPKTVRLGFETEYIEQDQPWIRFHSADVGELERPDHNEVETTNLTWKWLAEVGVTDSWSLGLMVPLVNREHLHLEAAEHHDEPAGAGADSGTGEEHDGEPDNSSVTIGDATGLPARWDFTRLGDIQATISYRLLDSSAREGTSLSIYAGLKLPTGETGVRNSQGEEAEITLQPGTGSVDPLFGARLRHRFSISGGERLVPVSLGVHVRTEGSDGKLGYRPGTEVVTSLASEYPVTSRFHVLGQLNFRYRDRDHVGSAPGVPEEHTGSEALYISPGIRLDLTEQFGAYSYVQVPVLQRVNGTQLVSRWNLLIGLTYRFEI